MTDMFRLDGKVAVVTGGGRGIGVMMARGLLQAGATVYLCSLKKAELDAVHDDPMMSAREALYQYTVRLLNNIAVNPEGAAVYFQEQPYIAEWFTEEQVAAVREKETQVYEHVHGLIDRGIASGEFYECDSHVLALGYIGMTLGAYRWLRPSGRRSAKEIAAEFSTALLRGLIRDESVRVESPLGVRTGIGTAGRSA